METHPLLLLVVEVMALTLDDIQLSNCKRDHAEGDDFVSLLSRKGAMNDVWIVLNRFPLCNQNNSAIAEARKSGQLRRHIEAERPHLAKPFGPETREEWIELGQVAIWVACGVWVAPETLCVGYCFRWWPSPFWLSVEGRAPRQPAPSGESNRPYPHLAPRCWADLGEPKLETPFPIS